MTNTNQKLARHTYKRGLYGNEFALATSDLSLDGLNGINDAGQVAFWAALADGRSGYFLWNSSAASPDDDIISAECFE